MKGNFIFLHSLFFNDASSCDICCFHSGAAEDKVPVSRGAESVGVMASTPSTAKKERRDDLRKTSRKVFGRKQSLAKVRQYSRIFRGRGGGERREGFYENIRKPQSG
jgi:hypothetical protein